jgi:hypothetical protein
MRAGWVVAAAVLAASGAAAEAMPLPVFLDKADALQRKGMLAIFSSDLSLLKNEVRSATESLRAERLAAKRAGKPQAYCPTQEGGSMNSDALLAALRQIPPARRTRMDVKDGVRTMLARKFPCR